MNGGFAEFAAHPAFGFVKEERKLEFWGETNRVQPFAGVREWVPTHSSLCYLMNYIADIGTQRR